DIYNGNGTLNGLQELNSHFQVPTAQHLQQNIPYHSIHTPTTLFSVNPTHFGYHMQQQQQQQQQQWEEQFSQRNRSGIGSGLE
ncbi:unnamed protein product, partial [Onchocerca ochengi]